MKGKYVIIAAIVSILILSSLIVFVLTSNNKTRPVSVDETQNIQNSTVNEVDLEENVIEENIIKENIIQENVVENTSKTTKTQEVTNDKKESTSKTTLTNSKPYYIKVNYGAQVVTIYKKDDSGNYTVPVKAMVCSTGTYTPKSGVYSIPLRWKWLGLQGGVFGQYCTQITGNILFHSVPYLTKGDPGSLEYWEYDKLGTYASAGCIRLTVKDAKWIYDNCAKGTKVEFYSSSNPGPLGKPSAKKISNAQGDLKNWDPTDPNPDNPWKNYKEQTSNKNQNTTNSTQTNTIEQDKNTITNTQTNTIKDDKNTVTNTNTVVNENKVTSTQNATNKQEKQDKVNDIKTNNTITDSKLKEQ